MDRMHYARDVSVEVVAFAYAYAGAFGPTVALPMMRRYDMTTIYVNRPISVHTQFQNLK